MRLTVQQVARVTGRHPETVRRWIRQGLPARRRRDGYVVEVSALGSWLSSPQMTQQLRTPVDTANFSPGYTHPSGETNSRPEPDMPVDVSSYLSLTEAAERVGRSTRTIRRWVAQGELPGAVRLKQQILIPPTALDALYRPCA